MTQNISFAYACKHSLSGVVHKYLEYKVDKSHENWCSRMKKSDLMYIAIQKGDTNLVKTFINHGFDPRSKNSLVLHLACLYGHFEIVELLINDVLGWSYSHCDYSPTEFISIKNNLAMRIAISFGHMNIAKFLYDEVYACYPDSFCMEVAYTQQDRNKLQFMIDHGNVKINEPWIVKTTKNHYYKMRILLSTDTLFFQNILKEDFLFYLCCDKDVKSIKFLLDNDMI